MGYSGPMGYGLRIPANQLGGWRGLWGVRGYGLFPIWVMRGSTVVDMREIRHEFSIVSEGLIGMLPVLTLPLF